MKSCSCNSKLEFHFCVQSYLGSFIRGNVLLIEMEYANGGTLAQILSQKEPQRDFMAERYILTIFEQITSAINYMHTENIMHRWICDSVYSISEFLNFLSSLSEI